MELIPPPKQEATCIGGALKKYAFSKDFVSFSVFCPCETAIYILSRKKKLPFTLLTFNCDWYNDMH